jgi:hypothetical protein
MTDDVRFLPKMVLTGFLAAWFTAASPMGLHVSVKATQDGVVRLPRLLGMTSTRLCNGRQTATHE